MKNNINYSILIPHKNTPDLLQCCLDSIPEREDIQIIIVDDNSDPDKVDFNAFPGLNRKNTEVYFTKEGKGAGYARNVGLRYAKGKWLLFADADDFFNKDFLEKADKYCDSTIDLIYFSATSIDSETGKPANRNKDIVKIINHYNPAIFTTREDLIYIYWTPWGKMFNHEFVKRNNLQFEEVLVGNDAMFVIRAGEMSGKIVVDKFPLYCITYNRNSLTFGVYDENHFNERFFAKIRINNYLHKREKIKYKIPVGPDIVFSLKYGFSKFTETIKISKENKNNIFFSTLKSFGKLIIKKILFIIVKY
jgi:glycosyltransferase involved in cell wall biosynthesis